MRTWDIFCRVVDNFGDAGVCWRLARQLAAERGDGVRLWIDDPGALSRIDPGIDPLAAQQRCSGIDVHRWTDRSPSPADVPNDVVIEAFACETPPSFVEAMARGDRKHAWINLEYLSAEDWIEGCHRLPSPHPRLPIVRHFYFPGLTAKTGGLLRERDLLARRDAFVADADAQRRWWSAHGVTRVPGSIAVSLFAYPNRQAVPLLRTWIGGRMPIVAVVPDGVLADSIADVAGSRLDAGQTWHDGNLTIAVVPFVPQSEFDTMLWACDVNFVRGEDSFVRAQWAGRPMIWHIYPQAHNAHRPKLEAFVDRYVQRMKFPVDEQVRRLFVAWNGEGDIGSVWNDARPSLDRWNAGARRWAESLSTQPDLVEKLAEFVETLL